CRAVVTGGRDRLVRGFDNKKIAVGRPPVPQDGGYDVAFRPHGGMGGTAFPGGAGRCWGVRTGGLRGAHPGHANEVVAVAFSPDGQTVATGSLELGCQALLWDLATGRRVGSPLRHREWVRAVAFRPDGRTALIAGGANWARFWDVATGRPLE